MGQMRKRSDKTRLAQGGRDTNAPWRRISIIFLHGIPVCLLPGREKHVSPVSEPVSGLSSGHAGDSTPGSAHQIQRARSHRRGRTHVHQQPGDAHQIPRLTVRPPDLHLLSSARYAESMESANCEDLGFCTLLSCLAGATNLFLSF